MRRVEAGDSMRARFHGFQAPQLVNLAAMDLDESDDEAEVIHMPAPNFGQDSSEEDSDDEFYDLPEPLPAEHPYVHGGHVVHVQNGVLNMHAVGDHVGGPLQHVQGGGGGDGNVGGWDIPELYIPLPNEYFEDAEGVEQNFEEDIPDPRLVVEPRIGWGPFLVPVPQFVYNCHMTITRVTKAYKLRHLCLLTFYAAAVIGVLRLSYQSATFYYRINKLMASCDNTLRNYEHMQIQLENLTTAWSQVERVLRERIDKLEATCENVASAGSNLITGLFRSATRYFLRALG